MSPSPSKPSESPKEPAVSPTLGGIYIPPLSESSPTKVTTRTFANRPQIHEVYHGASQFEALKSTLCVKHDAVSVLDLFEQEKSNLGVTVISDEINKNAKFKDINIVNVTLQQPTFFFMSLFVEYSKAFYIPMAPFVNHRYVGINELNRVRTSSKLSLSQLMVNEFQMSLGEATMTSFFYEINPSFQEVEAVRTRQARPDVTSKPKAMPAVAPTGVSGCSGQHPITSLAETTFVKNTKGPFEKYGMLVYDHLDYKMPSKETFVSVMKLFKKPPKTFDKEFHSKDDDVRTTHTFFDWRPLFDGEMMPDGSSLANLKEFVDYYDLPVDLSRFSEENLTAAHIEVRHVIQTLVPFRIAIIEGGHRFECAIRYLYGLPIENRISLHSDRNGAALNYPQECVLLQPLAMHVVQCGMHIEEFSSHIFEGLKAKSFFIMKMNETKVNTSWRSVIRKISEELPKVFPGWHQSLVACITYFQQYRPEGVKAKTELQVTTKRMRAILVVVMDIMKNTKPAADGIGKADDFKESVLKLCEWYMTLPISSPGKVFPSWSEVLKNIKYNGVTKHKMAISTVLWIYSLFPMHRSSWAFLAQFLASTNEVIHDTAFIFVYIAGVSNAIAAHANDQYDAVFKEKKIKKHIAYLSKDKNMRSVKAALRQYFRLSFAVQIMRLLMEIGTETPHAVDGFMTDIAKKFDNSGYKYNPSSNRPIQQNKNTSYSGMLQPILLSWSTYVKKHFVKEMTDYYTTEGDALEEDQVSFFKKLFPELIPRTKEQKSWSVACMDATNEFEPTKFQIFHLLVPPNLRITKARVTAILQGKEDWTEIFDDDTFDYKDTTSPSKTTPKKSRSSEAAPSPSQLPAAASAASRVVILEDEDYEPLDDDMNTKSVARRLSIARGSKKKRNYSENGSDNDSVAKKPRTEDTSNPRPAGQKTLIIIEEQMARQYAVLVAMSKHLRAWVNGNHSEMNIRKGVGLYLDQTEFYAKIMSSDKILALAKEKEATQFEMATFRSAISAPTSPLPSTLIQQAPHQQMQQTGNQQSTDKNKDLDPEKTKETDSNAKGSDNTIAQELQQKPTDEAKRQEEEDTNPEKTTKHNEQQKEDEEMDETPQEAKHQEKQHTNPEKTTKDDEGQKEDGNTTTTNTTQQQHHPSETNSEGNDDDTEPHNKAVDNTEDRPKGHSEEDDDHSEPRNEGTSNQDEKEKNSQEPMEQPAVQEKEVTASALDNSGEA